MSGCITGFDVIISIGINAHSKEEAKKIAEEWIKPLACPIHIVEVK